MEVTFYMENDLLRHYLAALSYRTTVTLKNAPDHFPELEIGENIRKPLEILNHITFLIAYTISCYQEFNLDEYRNMHNWETEIQRFYHTLEDLDQILQKESLPRSRTIEQLLQGPFADAMTHVGQLTMLRRLANAPVTYENYMDADIEIGRLRHETK
jgi:hypothetical protein